jgi:hypothetical protein
MGIVIQNRMKTAVVLACFFGAIAGMNQNASSWHIAKFCCNAKFSRYPGMADIEQAAQSSSTL